MRILNFTNFADKSLEPKNYYLEIYYLLPVHGTGCQCHPRKLKLQSNKPQKFFSSNISSYKVATVNSVNGHSLAPSLEAVTNSPRGLKNMRAEMETE